MISMYQNKSHEDKSMKIPSIKSLVNQVRSSSVNSKIQSPCVGGWITAWKDEQGRVWSQFKVDDGKRCPLQEIKLECEVKNKTAKAG
jgi:hypothetical protein